MSGELERLQVEVDALRAMVRELEKAMASLSQRIGEFGSKALHLESSHRTLLDDLRELKAETKEQTGVLHMLQKSEAAREGASLGAKASAEWWKNFRDIAQFTIMIASAAATTAMALARYGGH